MPLLTTMTELKGFEEKKGSPHQTRRALGKRHRYGGNLHQSRHYSQFLSLQLKARYEGFKTPVYAQAKVHHVR